MSERYEQLAARQRAMNRGTWETLQRHGVTGSTLLRLDFTYNAPNQAAAEGLVALLQDETDYDVRCESSRLLFRKSWTVQGRTQETAVSPEILDQWVDWMVESGAAHGCEFDGWGTSLAPHDDGAQRKEA